MKVSYYTNSNQLNHDTDILLVDTYGETSKFFSISKSVFLGGSLIKHGGQNPIEPARLGCKIFHGPYISNFTEIFNFLKKLNNLEDSHSKYSMLYIETLVNNSRINEAFRYSKKLNFSYVSF